ncbi:MULTISPECIES: polyprenyl diphosphate synthase [unclassified Oceanispirochaeta]|uniref:polyprenyl diphosphate synthase n=1 Tax=unclassified Oceanispirochaeta TaxID=2635722 RepID=UPI000E08FFEC|nr:MULTISPECIES: polyprenyl diphosphate synthase [unclassified Oceanispirochaeta]MBF9017205.1 di-trans,poly-cis-decaprenylcistransferase [Oceanispirochaeta sp. M2]NPD73654.1 di-trans,poly-cis-decaprenylcistransferase [Oceanispirochaeta sp. M1]RDG30584.1 di-trans,poly-cis-decaprenylcistransferase [Oceanispirochaeta sp. M1]
MASQESIPSHIGIIMDGNGRWAKQRGQIRSAGHREGLNAAKAIVKAASDMGLQNLSLYVFSTENWKRTEDEVSFLMVLIKSYLKKEYQFYKDNSIRVVHSGDLSRLPEDIQKEIKTVKEQTSHFTGLTVNLLINYGGQDEVVRSVNSHIKTNPGQAITAEILWSSLDNPDLPPVDLLIRTGGEKRISNFLIWQTAYSELYFSDKLWPDWTGEDLQLAVDSFSNRERRFGGVK